MKSISDEKSFRPGVGSDSIVLFDMNEENPLFVSDSFDTKGHLEFNTKDYITLGHELIHACRSMLGFSVPMNILAEPMLYTGYTIYDENKPDLKKYTEGTALEELQTTGTALDKGAFNITVNDLRREHKLPIRVAYDSEEVDLYVKKIEMIKFKNIVSFLMIFLSVFIITSCSAVGDANALNGHSCLQIVVSTENGDTYYCLNKNMDLVSGTLKGEDRNWVEEKVENPLAETPTDFHESLHSKFPSSQVYALNETLHELEGTKTQFNEYNDDFSYACDAKYTYVFVWIDDVGYYWQPNGYNNYFLSNVAQQVVKGSPLDLDAFNTSFFERQNIRSEVYLNEDETVKFINCSDDAFFDKYKTIDSDYISKSNNQYFYLDQIIFQDNGAVFSFDTVTKNKRLLMNECKQILMDDSNVFLLNDNGDVFVSKLPNMKKQKKLLSGIERIWCNPYDLLPGATMKLCYVKDDKVHYVDFSSEKEVVLENCPTELLSVLIDESNVTVLDKDKSIHYYELSGKLKQTEKTNAKQLFYCGESSHLALLDDGKLVYWKRDSKFDSNFVITENASDVFMMDIASVCYLNEYGCLETVEINNYSADLNIELSYLTVIKTKLSDVDRIIGTKKSRSIIVEKDDNVYIP